MNRQKKVVITTYGHDRTIDKIAVSIFEEANGYGRESDAASYCHMINTLELKGESWVYARAIPDNTPFLLDSFLPDDFVGTILSLDPRAFQLVLRESENRTIAKAIKSASDEVREKVFSNMSERAVKTLKEDMEFMGHVRFSDVDDAQKEILDTIRHLRNCGEIVIARSCED